MIVTNISGSYFVLLAGSQQVIRLPSEESVEIDSDLYSNNENLRTQIDNLYNSGRLSVAEEPEGFPLSNPVEEELFPETYDMQEQDFVLSKGDGVAGVSVEFNQTENCYYGSVNLRSSDGSSATVSAYPSEDLGAMVVLSKDQNEEGKFYKLLVDGFPLTIDPSSATAEDIANLLIQIGLCEEES